MYLDLMIFYLSMCLYNVFTYLHVSSNPFACLFDTVDMVQPHIRLTFIPVILKVHLHPSHGPKTVFTQVRHEKVTSKNWVDSIGRACGYVYGCLFITYSYS